MPVFALTDEGRNGDNMQTINMAGINGCNNGYRGNGLGIWGSDAGSKTDGKNGKNGTIFAGNINNMTNDRVEQKRAQARKQATKAVMDQFASDNEITDGLNEKRERNAWLRTEMDVMNQERNSYVEAREALKEQYGIEEDSKEQQDLELYRKAKKLYKTGQLGTMSKDELERLAGMDEMTEYQQRALEYDDIIERYDADMEKMKLEMNGNTRAVELTKREMVKNTGMIKAEKMADNILENASDAIVGMLVDDAKKHMDEEMEELVEAAKKEAEKKEEEEARLEEKKEEDEEQEELIEQIQEGTTEQAKLQQEIDKILKEAELLAEDIKGLVVNGTL